MRWKWLKEGGEVGLDVATACCLQMCDGQHGMLPAVVGLSSVKILMGFRLDGGLSN